MASETSEEAFKPECLMQNKTAQRQPKKKRSKEGGNGNENSVSNEENAVEREDKEQNENGDESTKNEEGNYEKEEDQNKTETGDNGDRVLKYSGVGNPNPMVYNDKMETAVDVEKKKKKSESQEEDKTKRFRALIIVSGIVVIGLSITIALLLSRYRQDSVTPLDSLRMFHNSFAQLEADFPDQKTRFWRILRNRAAAHLKNPNPKKPLVFMFTAGPSAHDVLECIARKLAKTLEPEENKLGYIKSTDYRKYSSLDDAKKNLDDTLKQLLQEKTTVLIFDVDQLPVQSPLLFYEYCDNENAPFKRAAIIFTVRLPLQPDPSLDPPKAEGLVAKYLRETWGKQDYTRPDDIPPLVNRMTDTVVMVNEESNQSVERSCAK